MGLKTKRNADTVSNKSLEQAGEGSLRDDDPLLTEQFLPQEVKWAHGMGACPRHIPMSRVPPTSYWTAMVCRYKSLQCVHWWATPQLQKPPRRTIDEVRFVGNHVDVQFISKHDHVRSILAMHD